MPTVQGRDVHSHFAEQRAEHPGASCHGGSQQVPSAEPTTAPAEAQEAAHPLFIVRGKPSQIASSSDGAIQSSPFAHIYATSSQSF